MTGNSPRQVLNRKNIVSNGCRGVNLVKFDSGASPIEMVFGYHVSHHITLFAG